MIVIAGDKGVIGKFLVIVRAGGQSSTRRRCLSNLEGAPSRFALDRSDRVLAFFRRDTRSPLLHYEQFDDAENAIRPEKRLKKWNRVWKIRLIEENNPYWVDLYPTIAGP